jgi:hypothetical protein
MNLHSRAAAHYAVIRAALLMAEAELSEAIATAQGAGEHDIAADLQELLAKVQRAHRKGDRLAKAIADLPGVGGGIQTYSGGNADEKGDDSPPPPPPPGDGEP